MSGETKLKQILLGFVALVALSLGVAPAANAAPYPGTVPTKSFMAMQSVAKRGTTPAAYVRVLPASGNGIARGRVAIRCYWGSNVVKQSPLRNYASFYRVLMRGPVLTRKGTWRCITIFYASGIYKSSVSKISYVKVRR